jgi:hypothetical protein
MRALRDMPKRRKLALLSRLSAMSVALNILVAAASAEAQSEAAMPEDEIKAAFLFNFARFIEWPSRQNGPDSPLILGVIGRDEFADTLERTVQNKSVRGRTLAVKRLSSARDARGCHMVFVGFTDRGRILQVIDAVGPSAVLTVGDAEAFTQKGGMVRFFPEGSRMRFEINVDAAARAGIRISSRLLQLAHVVRDSAAAR